VRSPLSRAARPTCLRRTPSRRQELWRLRTIFLGNLIVLLPTDPPRARRTLYGIPFPVYGRARFGEGCECAAILRACIVRVRLVRYRRLDLGDAIYTICVTFSTAIRRTRRTGSAYGRTISVLPVFSALSSTFRVYRGIDTSAGSTIKAPLLIAARIGCRCGGRGSRRAASGQSCRSLRV